MLIPCYLVTLTASHNDRTHIYIYKPVKRVSHRAVPAVGHAHQPRGHAAQRLRTGQRAPLCCRPSLSFGHVAHSCDTAQPVAARWRRRLRRTRRRQPRSRACATPSRRRCGPAGPPQNNDAEGAAAAAATAPACACLLCPTGVASRSLSRHCRRTGAGRASALELG